jgi:nucleoside-diphosphate-sugar epimerase
VKNNFHGKHVLITGGLGFIGSALAHELVKFGAIVTILDSLIPEFGGNMHNIEGISSKVSLNISDMRDSTSLDVLVRDKDYIFHLAGQVSHGDSMRDPQTDLEVNCVSTMNLVESCRRYNPDVRLIYTSTRQVYGIPQSLPVSESHPVNPIDVNGINKLAGEYYHILYDKTYGLRSSVLRLTNTYGPRQQIRNNRQGFIGIFIRQALKGEKIKIFGDGNQVRDFNYIDDVVHALLLAAGNEKCYGNIYNLGSPNYYSLIQFVDILKEITGVEFETIPFPDDKKIIDIGDYYGDYSLFAKDTGWSPKVDLIEGITRTTDFYNRYKEEYWL